MSSQSRPLRYAGLLLACLLVASSFGPAQPRAAAAPADAVIFQTASVSDASDPYLTFPFELEEEGSGPGGPPPIAAIPAAMSAVFSNIVVIEGGGIIGGDVLEFDVTITNTSPAGSGIILSAYAFQSKFSESPALASRIGDKLFYATAVAGSLSTSAASPLATVKKNGTSNGLFTGKWKGICINSSVDFIPEFNSGLEDESLECAGNRADTNFDGEPELLTGSQMLGLRPGESQTIRLRLDSGTTDGALHVVEAGTLQGRVAGDPVTGPNGLTYFVPTIDNTGITNPNVLAIPDFGDNKVLRNADGTFNPTFAPQAGPDGLIGSEDDYTFAGQQYLTLPRRNFAFSDIIGRNHSCATYGLSCSGSPELGFLDTGDLVPGVQNFAAILRGFGEFYDPNGDFIPDENPLASGETRPNFPYNVLCDNCGGVPYIPIAEFYLDNGDGTLTRQIVGGTYGDPVADPYLAIIDSLTAEEIKQEIIPEPDPGGPCQQPLESRKPACAQLGGSAFAEFYDLTVVPGGGINGGDAIEFNIEITNNSTDAYLTAFNYQTKQRGLADIGILDGYTQDRRDIRADSTLTPCTDLSDAACYNPALGVGHFPNVIGNGLLFGQMVWTNNDAGREGPVIPDQVYVDPINGIDPVPYWLESVKKNGPFSPILKGNVNFICVKSGLFDNDPDADAACAGEPAILANPDLPPTPDNITQRLGLPPGETQTVRIRMEFGDFRGAMLQIAPGTLTPLNVDSRYTSTSGLARFFDCSDQRELEFCHPDLVGDNIGYLPNTNADWLTPQTLEEIEYVIINQPGDAPTVMNFQDNFGYILAMAGFVPSAEFYAPDPNEDLIGTPYEGVLIRQQVLGSYGMTSIPTFAPNFISEPATTALVGQLYTYRATATANPAPRYSLPIKPRNMRIDSRTGVITWTPNAPGIYDVRVRANNGISPVSQQDFQIVVGSPSPATLTIVKLANPAAPWIDWKFQGSGGIGNFLLDNDPDSATPDRMTFTLSPGSYTVTERDKPGNWDLSISCSGAAPSISGTSATVTLAQGADVTCTFVNQRKPQIQISLYDDANASGAYDQGEPALRNWRLFLYADNGSGGWSQIQPRTVRSNNSGIAHYTSLTPGLTHLVCQEARSGWTNTAPGGAAILHDGKVCQVVADLGYGEERQVAFGNYKGTPPTIYRARQVGARVWIERNIALAGLGDFDSGDAGDGWALVGRTNGAADNGELRGFFVQAGVPYAIVFNYSNNQGNRCILVSPRSLDKVTKGQTRLVNTANTNYTPCPATGFSQLP